ncbi:hypothetical protein ACVWXL_009175 [Bradyrhizobium sp. GM22.5]
MVPRALRTGLWTALFGLSLWRGVVPALWLQAIRNFIGAVNRPEPILWIRLAAIPLCRARVGLPGLSCSLRRLRARW